MPADLLDEIPRTSIRYGDQRPQKDGTVSLLIDVNPTIVAAFARLPVIDAEVSTSNRPLPNAVADDFLTAARADRAVISWHICWRGEHNQTGFELAINGVTLWHPEAPPGHSVYVHVPPTRPHLADDLATAVGGRILGEPAIGW